jgi:hypothetical protein
VGVISIILDVANPGNPAAAEQVEFLVDSGMRCSVVPTILLERLGIKPIVEQVFILASGEKMFAKRARLSLNMESGLAAPILSSANREMLQFSANTLLPR